MTNEELLEESRGDFIDVLMGSLGKLSATELVERERKRLDRHALSVVEASVPKEDHYSLEHIENAAWRACGSQTLYTARKITQSETAPLLTITPSNIEEVSKAVQILSCESVERHLTSCELHP